MLTAKELNRLDNATGRKVWFQYWDTLIHSQASYFARLNYVHQNPVKHQVVANAENYRWCSAAWFAENASPAFQGTVESFSTDHVNVPDDYRLGVRRHVAALKAVSRDRTHPKMQRILALRIFEHNVIGRKIPGALCLLG